MTSYETKIPRFTVIIPTRNRPVYFRDALYSAARQTFGDLEIIVSDNSDPEFAAQNQMAVSALGDRRVSYITPPHILPMVDHWEWAFQQAHGDFVGVLTDRMALRLNALERINSVLLETKAEVVCYLSENIKEFPGYKASRVQRKHGHQLISSDKKINEYSHALLTKDTPRVLNSFSSKNLLERLRGDVGHVFDSVSPDYYLMFRILKEIDAYAAIKEPLLLVQGEHLSNGRANATGKNNKASSDFWKSIPAHRQEYMKLGPIPDDITVMPNIILREYEVVARMPTGKQFPKVSTEEFYKQASHYARTLAKAGELADSTRVTLDVFAERHSLAKQKVPDNKRRPVKAFLDKIWTAPVLGPGLCLVRIVVERVLAVSGISSRISAKDLPALLDHDARAAKT